MLRFCRIPLTEFVRVATQGSVAHKARRVLADRGQTLWYRQEHLGQAKSMQRTYGFSMRGTWVLLGVVVLVLLIALAINWLAGG